MPKAKKLLEYDNVNGVTLTLKVDMHVNLPYSRLFTVSYKSTAKKSSWPKLSLFFAALFNIFALSYVRISLTALVIILIVFSFLVFFWITHSVQSGKKPVSVLVILYYIILYYSVYLCITESVLFIPTVGIQCSVKYVYGREDVFIPWPNVDDIIINEVVKLNRVLFTLTVLVKNQSQENETLKLIPLFKYTKPRLAMLETIYSELQSLLTKVNTSEQCKDDAQNIG